MNILIMGPPGAGKGTQAEKLADRYHIPHISTGQILRDLAANEDPLGIEARDKYWGKGKWVPDKVMIQLVGKRLDQEDCKEGFILDGFPRTVEQAEYLDGITSIDYVIHLHIDESVAVERLAKRQEGRADDTLETLHVRLQEHETKTAPLLDYYRAKGNLYDIDGSPSIPEVEKNIHDLLSK